MQTGEASAPLGTPFTLFLLPPKISVTVKNFYC